MPLTLPTITFIKIDFAAQFQAYFVLPHFEKIKKTSQQDKNNKQGV